MEAREVIAITIYDWWGQDEDSDQPLLPDQILSALSEAGYTIARLEQEAWKMCESSANPERLVPVGPVHAGKCPDCVALYRIAASPVAPR